MLAEMLAVTTPRVVIYEDNQTCIKMATNPIVSAHNHHFAMRMWWLRDQVTTGTVQFCYVPTKSMVADILTKVLPAPTFRALCALLFAGRSLFYAQ